VRTLPIGHSLFGDDNCAIADVQLRAVIRNAQTQALQSQLIASPTSG
jgi:hypothetical protein